MSVQATDLMVVTEAGVYDDMPDSIYHDDPVPDSSLSCSGSKLLLPPSCPALYQWARNNGRIDKPAFDFGRAAHLTVLGAGAPIAVIDAKDWRTNAAKDAAEEARAEGQTPLLRKDYQTVCDMADAIADHPTALSLLQHGKPEQSAFWQDEETGAWLRCRFDWLPDRTESRTVLVDYKSADCAHPSAFGRSMANFGYPQQGAWYLNGAKTLGRASDDAVFLLIVQEKTPPYPVSVVQLVDDDLQTGAAINRAAVDLYAKCVADDHWPGYPSEPVRVSCPPWYHNRVLEVTL